MNARLKIVYLLAYALPGFFLVATLLFSFELYLTLDRLYRERALLSQKLTQLQLQLHQVEPEKQIIANGSPKLKQFFNSASSDVFLSRLTSATSPRLEILSSSTSPSSDLTTSSPTAFKAKSAVQLTITGSSNTLIAAFGLAQTEFPSVFPIDWTLKKTLTGNDLQLAVRLIVPETPQVTPPASAVPQKAGVP